MSSEIKIYLNGKKRLYDIRAHNMSILDSYNLHWCLRGLRSSFPHVINVFTLIFNPQFLLNLSKRQPASLTVVK